MNETKPAVFSKINWTAVLLFVVGLGGLADKVPPKWGQALTLIAAVALIAFRNFFPVKPIEGVV